MVRESLRTTTKAHTDTGAITLLIINYGASLLTLILMHNQIQILRVALVTALFALNTTSLVRVHLQLISRPTVKSVALFLINTLPYLALLVNPQPWLVIPAVSLAVFLTEALRGRGRSVVANVFGTLLIASTYMPWYVMMGGHASLRVLIVYITWVLYHLFASLYVEGKLPFRKSVKPWFSSITWLTSLPALAYGIAATTSLFMLIILLEPTVRALMAFWEGKLGMDGFRVRTRRLGFTLMFESILMISLLLLYISYPAWL
ncbi:hypothetical protein [Vulcanisaeta thermophila]|uniref:hypothetical protein n=1 Tax=Vulcanisaeta thermophila TaxID=867917 RepID=UPI00085387DD|nr:hypothetical protein [Vulcanisaeta thermophila]